VSIGVDIEAWPSNSFALSIPQRLELRRVGVLARDGVGERPLGGDAVERTVDPLAEATHPLIGDSLSSDRIPQP
jgi:hypothetical protein